MVMTPKDNIAIVKNLYTLFNQRKVDEASKLVASQCTWTNIPTGQAYVGPSGFKDFCQSWLTAFSDARVEIRNQIANEDMVVTEFTGRGTHDGPLQSPNGTVPATRKKLELSFVEIVKLESGKIVEARAYFDSATLMRQLGILPESVGSPR
jgi:steroid delta-isomerase-like uncharacterized protein